MADLRAQTMTRSRPLPQLTLDNHEFYEAARNGELRFQRCADCATWRHYPRPACPHCLSRRYGWELASGRGRVYTWTIVHGPTLPGFEAEVPYNVVDVLLSRGSTSRASYWTARPKTSMRTYWSRQRLCP